MDGDEISQVIEFLRGEAFSDHVASFKRFETHREIVPE
jgi:hypothetical protein